MGHLRSPDHKLGEVRDFIDANGLEMFQAQTLMSRKIEEPTLYLLQISEENKALRNKNQ